MERFLYLRGSLRPQPRRGLALGAQVSPHLWGGQEVPRVSLRAAVGVTRGKQRASLGAHVSPHL